MKYACKKVEDCFSDSRTFQYELSVSSDHFLTLLDKAFEIKINRKYRRPFFTAENSGGLRLKGVLERSVINVSFPTTDWETEKARFDAWLEELNE